MNLPQQEALRLRSHRVDRAILMAILMAILILILRAKLMAKEGVVMADITPADERGN